MATHLLDAHRNGLFGTVIHLTNATSYVAQQQFSSHLHVPDTWPWQRDRVRAEPQASDMRLGEVFHRFCATVVARLPLRLNSVVAPTFLGFALINGFTFLVDLLLLTALHGWLQVPLVISVTVAYACAFTLSYSLNRTMNFQSHAPVGPQFTIYVVVVAVNYLAFILGVSSALTAVGIDFRMARILAACCEAVYMYSAMRWVVFRR
jgi:putative flippase GtrA